MVCESLFSGKLGLAEQRKPLPGPEMILNEDYGRIFGVLLLAFSAALMVEAPLLVFQYGSNEIA